MYTISTFFNVYPLLKRILWISIFIYIIIIILFYYKFSKKIILKNNSNYANLKIKSSIKITKKKIDWFKHAAEVRLAIDHSWKAYVSYAWGKF